MLVADLGDVARVLLEGRVVDEDVELAEFADRLLNGAFAEPGVGNVARNQNAAPAFLFDCTFRIFRILVFI